MFDTDGFNKFCLMQRAITKYSTQKTETLETLDGSVDHLKKYSTIPRHIFFFFFFFTIVEEVKNPSLQFYIPRTRMSSWWISQI